MTPWWQRDGVISRVLVLAGVGVTLVGIVMLLVLAAQNGLLQPPVRVIGGAALAAGLVVVGARVMNRPGGRVGGTALMATGFAGFYLDTLAVTAFYEWLPAVGGLALALAVAGLGMAAAWRWSSQSLAAIVLLCCAALAPVLTSGVTGTLVAFLFVLAATGAVPEVLRGWVWLAPIRMVPLVLAAALLPLLRDLSDPALMLGAASIAVLGLVSGLAAVLSHRDNVLASLTMTLAFLPALTTPVAGAAARAVWSLSFVALIGLSLLAVRRAPLHAKVCLSVAAGVLAIQATGALALQFGTVLPVAVLAVILIAAELTRPHPALAASGQIALCLAGLVMMAESNPGVLISSELAGSVTGADVLSALIVLAGAGLGTLALVRRNNRDALDGGVPIDLVIGMYALAVTLTGCAAAAFPGQTGFALGQFLITTTWMIAAASLLQVGLSRPRHARMALTFGLLLAAAAFAKLFLFDLATLSGVARAASFLVVGLLLLAAGTRYARVFAEREGAQPAQ